MTKEMNEWTHEDEARAKEKNCEYEANALGDLVIIGVVLLYISILCGVWR